MSDLSDADMRCISDLRLIDIGYAMTGVGVASILGAFVGFIFHPAAGVASFGVAMIGWGLNMTKAPS